MAPSHANEDRELIAMQCRILQMETELRAVKGEATKIQGGGTAILGLLGTHSHMGFAGGQQPQLKTFELEQRACH
ncbi:hypothetical protein LTR95_014829, partial [Oleoguttula sp. CCFEE 5521]